MTASVSTARYGPRDGAGAVGDRALEALDRAVLQPFGRRRDNIGMRR
jgi:hypothetical protein